MNPRRIGLAMVYGGAATQAVGVLWEAIRRSSTTGRGDLFDLGVPAHALFFAGLCAVVLGAVLIAFGPWLYAPAARPGRRMVQVLAPVFAFSMIAGCASAADHSATKAKAPTATAKIKLVGGSTSKTPSWEGRTVLTQTATGKSPCEKASPAPASPGEVGNGTGGSASNTDAEGGHGPRGMLQPLPVTEAQRKELIKQMSEARGVVAKYPTVASAEAAGYRESTVYVPCIGAHYTNMNLVTHFDPAAPSELLYDGTKPDSHIVGLSYLVWHPGGPPAGFAGPNDVFHQHNANGGLCLRGGQVVGGENMSIKTCELIGGKKSARLMADVYMVHAWVAPGWECSWGVFAGECPELGGKLGGTAYDK
jgi:hypothetical protein